MRGIGNIAAATLVALVVAALPVQAQEPEREVAPWAPQWKVGDWWKVRTFQRDLSKELTSPAPAKGALPRPSEDPAGKPIPGYPPLRNGVPEGYKVGNTFAFEVVRKEEVKYDDDPPGTAPEAFWVVHLRTTEGSSDRSAELWFAADDLVLSKVVLGVTQETDAPSERWLEGTCQLGPGLSGRIGFPLDWPDLKAARRARQRLELPTGSHVEQKVRTVEKGTPKEEVRVLLQAAAPSDAQGKDRPRCLFSFRPGQPYWTRLLTPRYLCELSESGRKE